MAQRSQEQSILVSPSISDRLLSDKANSNFCFLGWWAVFAPKSKSSGLCWIRLAGFYLLFRTSSANPRLGGELYCSLFSLSFFVLNWVLCSSCFISRNSPIWNVELESRPFVIQMQNGIWIFVFFLSYKFNVNWWSWIVLRLIYIQPILSFYESVWQVSISLAFFWLGFFFFFIVTWIWVSYSLSWTIFYPGLEKVLVAI